MSFPDPSPGFSLGENLRLFLALPLPEPIRALVVDLQQPPSPDLRWTPPEQLHLTLRFLGDTPESKTDPLTGRLAEIRVEPFLLALEGVGAFPPSKSPPHAPPGTQNSKSKTRNPPPRVLWLGVGSGHPRLHQLRQRVDDALLAANLDADLRHFHPHITLARCADTPAAAATVTQWLKTHRDFAGPTFRVDSFELRSSQLRPGGAVHRTLAAFPLAK